MREIKAYNKKKKKSFSHIYLDMKNFKKRIKSKKIFFICKCKKVVDKKWSILYTIER